MNVEDPDHARRLAQGASTKAAREDYFDFNASTPVDEAVLAAALPWMREEFANASSAHPEGRRSAAAIADARAQIAAGIGAAPEEIFFTSGGSESNNWALSGSISRARRAHIVSTAIEHKSVLSTLRALEADGHAVTRVSPGEHGAVRVEDVLDALRPETALVSVMLANNETGVLQPVAELGAALRRRGVRFHVDAVAAVGKHPIDVRALACDLLSLSAHKLYAPKGCGVLYVRSGVELHPLIHGCGQQGGMRGGTENTFGAVAFGRAFERLREGAFGTPESIAKLRDDLWSRLEAAVPGILRNGSGPRLPNTINVSLPGAEAPRVVELLGARGFSVSGGAAAAGAASHVLLAMGCSEERARSSVRISLGAHTTREAVARLVEALCAVLPAARAGSAAGPASAVSGSARRG